MLFSSRQDAADISTLGRFSRLMRFTGTLDAYSMLISRWSKPFYSIILTFEM